MFKTNCPDDFQSHDDQTRPRQRRGRGGTGSQSRDSSHFQDSPSPHSSYHTSSCAAPAPAPLAPASAPPGPPGVMSVAELVRQPGRDHLPYLTPYPHGRGQTCAWINRMMYSALDKGHPTFTDFPTDKQHLWFRQFAQEFNWNSDETLFIYHHFVHKVMANYGKQIHEWKKKWEINKCSDWASSEWVIELPSLKQRFFFRGAFDVTGQHQSVKIITLGDSNVGFCWKPAVLMDFR
ncbi:hypothetical protein YC2023_083816 [Brassica napus]